MEKIIVKDYKISITGLKDDDYVSLTDIARIKNPEDPNSVIANWIRRVSTLDYLAIWERLNNVNFKPTDFEGFKSRPGENAFTISPKKWVEITCSIGIRIKLGKQGGTFAHKDIALEFASWISPEVKLYIIKEFQRLKIKEEERSNWLGKRLQSKLNYLIHTDAIKTYLVPIELSNEQKSFIYASEADLLNVALFGLTSKEWKERNINTQGNMRDYASLIELSILSNLELINSKLIEQKISQSERLIILNKEANKEKEIFNKNIKSIGE